MSQPSGRPERTTTPTLGQYLTIETSSAVPPGSVIYSSPRWLERNDLSEGLASISSSALTAMTSSVEQAVARLVSGESDTIRVCSPDTEDEMLFGGPFTVVTQLQEGPYTGSRTMSMEARLRISNTCWFDPASTPADSGEKSSSRLVSNCSVRLYVTSIKESWWRSPKTSAVPPGNREWTGPPYSVPNSPNWGESMG